MVIFLLLLTEKYINKKGVSCWA